MAAWTVVRASLDIIWKTLRSSHLDGMKTVDVKLGMECQVCDEVSALGWTVDSREGTGAFVRTGTFVCGVCLSVISQSNGPSGYGNGFGDMTNFWPHSELYRLSPLCSEHPVSAAMTTNIVLLACGAPTIRPDLRSLRTFSLKAHNPSSDCPEIVIPASRS